MWERIGYTPSTGYFPIYNLEQELVLVSLGQQEFHDAPNRIKLMSGGVRSGKSVVIAMDAVEDTFEPNGLMWIVGPDYEQARSEFIYLHDALAACGFIQGKASIPQEGACGFTTKWGFVCETKSSKDLEKLAGRAPDVFLATEANQSPAGIVAKAAERTLEKNGRILISGTLEKSEPWYAERWERWQGPNPEGARSFSMPSWSNTFLFPGGREDPKIKEMEALINDPALFLERCAAIPCKPSGLVHGTYETKKHIKQIEYNDRLPVELAVDPATHTYAIEVVQWETLPVYRWLERLEREPKGLTREQLNEMRTMMYVIDEVYLHNVIDQQVIPLVKAKPYYKHIRGGVIDTAGTHRNATKSQQQVWIDETGGQVTLRSRYVFIEQSINAMNLILRNDPYIGVPLIQFSDRMTTTIAEDGRPNGVRAEFGLYRYPPYVTGRAERPKPIDSSNDGIKALSYWRFDRHGPVVERRKLGKMKIRRSGLV